MATQPIVPPNIPSGTKPIAPPLVPPAPGKAGPPPVPGAAKAGMKAPPGVQPQTGNAPPGEENPDEHLGPALSFWQLPWVQNILPFVTSLSVHAGILIFGFLLFGVYKQLQKEPHQEQVIIPDSNMVDAGPPGGIPNVGLGGDPNQKAAQDKDPTSKTEEWAEKKGPTVDVTAQGGGSGDEASIIAPGAAAGFGRGGGVGAGHGDGHGGGDGDGSGPLAMFGTPGGGGIGPKGPVFGNGGNARQIVFLCDATGSMLNKMAQLKDELNKAVVGLRPVQAFNIIFYQDKGPPMMLGPGMVPATPENKRKAGSYLENVTSQGITDPIPALEASLKLHPQLLYFLTDAADFPDPQAVLDTIKKYNPDHKIKINTILFVEDKTEHDKNADSEGLMKKIATESGGKFRWVEMDSLR